MPGYQSKECTRDKKRNKTVRKGHISQENNNPVYHIIAEFQAGEAKTVELKRSQVHPL